MKRYLAYVAVIALLLCLGGCKVNEKEKETKDPYNRINGEITISLSNFPDENFRQFIAGQLDSDKNGNLSDAEIRDVNYLPLENMRIYDLTGIEVFYNLSILKCEHNLLTELDLSKNKNLQTLECRGNSLTKLNLGANKKLASVRCQNNDLTELDVSQNPALNTLNCAGNQLKELDLTQNYLLEYLDCRDNKIKSLDLCHALPGLKHHEDTGILVNLTDKEADNGPAIDEKNFPDVTFRCIVLSEIDEDHNGILSEKEMKHTISISLDGIDDLTGIKYFTALQRLQCSNSTMEELDISKNRALQRLILYGVTRLGRLDCSNNPELYYVECSGPALGLLDIRNCSPNITVVLAEGMDVEVIGPPTEADTRNAATP